MVQFAMPWVQSVYGRSGLNRTDGYISRPKTHSDGWS